MSKKDALTAFLNADLEATKMVELKRLGVEIEVKGLSTEKVNKLREQSTFGDNIDDQKFSSLLVARACVNLDFGDPKMLDYYGATDAADCVQKALLAGELVKLSQAVLEASGFDDIAEQVKAAKN